MTCFENASVSSVPPPTAGFDLRVAWVFVRKVEVYGVLLNRLKVVLGGARAVLATASADVREAIDAELADLQYQIGYEGQELSQPGERKVSDAVERAQREAGEAGERALQTRLGQLHAQLREVEAWLESVLSG